MKTAVEWYANQIEQLEIKILQGYISNNQAIAELPNILDKAKQMEKKQIIDAVYYNVSSMTHDDLPAGESYYNRRFKQQEQWKEYYAYLDGINGLPQWVITLKSLVICRWIIGLQVILLVKDVELNLKNPTIRKFRQVQNNKNNEYIRSNNIISANRRANWFNYLLFFY